jgi:hypothetical protein
MSIFLLAVWCSMASAEVTVPGNALPICIDIEHEIDVELTAVQEASKELYLNALSIEELSAEDAFPPGFEISDATVKTYSCDSTIWIEPRFPAPGCCDSWFLIVGSMDYYVFFRKKTGLHHWSKNVRLIEENERLEDWNSDREMPPFFLCKSGSCIREP